MPWPDGRTVPRRQVGPTRYLQLVVPFPKQLGATYPRLTTSATFPASPRSRALQLDTDSPRRLARKRPRVSTVSAQDRAQR